MSLNNIDDLLSQVETTLSAPAEPVPSEDVESVEQESAVETKEPAPKAEPEPEAEAPKEEQADTDEYGTPVTKKERTYTEAEVQQMMRDRNARGEFARQEALRQQQEAAPQNAEHANEDWESQLESFVEQTLTKREQRTQEIAWQNQQQQAQAEFEVKFNTGAAKYADFEQVVMGKPLTPQMVIATRGMSDPAAFIYAAAKTQANELERISKIPDAFAQAVELGKLDERMKKARTGTSSAPKPISQVKGDSLDKSIKPKSVDDILREEDAKRLAGRR